MRIRINIAQIITNQTAIIIKKAVVLFVGSVGHSVLSPLSHAMKSYEAKSLQCTYFPRKKGGSFNDFLLGNAILINLALVVATNHHYYMLSIYEINNISALLLDEEHIYPPFSSPFVWELALFPPSISDPGSTLIPNGILVPY